MTGPEHFIEAERWLTHARDAYMDDSSDPGRREDYATEAAYLAAVREANEAHEQSIREAGVFAALGQAHATLAQAAATALVADEDLAGEARCRVCGCTESQACEGSCHWVPDPQMGDLCSRCAPDTAPHWLAEILAQCDAGEITPSDGITEIRRQFVAAQLEDASPTAYPAPGSEIPDQPGYVVGKCGHRVAGSEWRIGFRTCERCPNADKADGEVSES